MFASTLSPPAAKKQFTFLSISGLFLKEICLVACFVISWISTMLSNHESHLVSILWVLSVPKLSDILGCALVTKWGLKRLRQFYTENQRGENFRLNPDPWVIAFLWPRLKARGCETLIKELCWLALGGWLLSQHKAPSRPLSPWPQEAKSLPSFRPIW